MHLPALSGSMLVHLLGALLALMPGRVWIDSDGTDHSGSIAGSVINFGRERPWSGRSDRAPGAPSLFVLSNMRLKQGAKPLRASQLDQVERPCPRSSGLDQDAEPGFPTSGRSAPYAWIDQSGENPAICVLIAADGHVVEAFLTKADPLHEEEQVLLATALNLRFIPAKRDGIAVASWYQLVLNRREGASSYY